ncbi:MAG: IS66 family transposase [Myxococcales bacterium]|nr:IS66 family transposase [Myxococcales bacterium]
MSATDETAITPLAAEVAALKAELAIKSARITALEMERDRLRAAYDGLRVDLELLRRRITVAKAERVDTAQLELEFAGKLAALDALSAKLDAAALPVDKDGAPSSPASPSPPPRKKPLGRRDLREADLPEERVEIADPILEARVERGEAERMGFEESCKLGWQRGGLRRIVVARVKYRIAGESPETTVIATTEKPAEAFERSLAAPSLLARIAVDKYCDGLPLHRQEERFARLGVRIDRGTMCRWMEDLGATVGATIVAAAHAEAMATAFCVATDATGVLVQPERGMQKRQPCRRGHYFVKIADRDHVFFEYIPKETSSAVGELFKGFAGPFIQADAKSVYDALFRPPEEDADLTVPSEVGCWSHARRKFWEATVARSVVAREGLARIARIFALERKWQGRAPDAIKALRQAFARPHVEAFFEWADTEYQKVIGERGLLRSALGYAVRQKPPLMRYLDDGRLIIDNNRSERELRRIAVGRNAWLFVGSDDHGVAAGHLFSLIASARLHRLDPEAYLRDLVRVLAHWPKARYLELAPRYWATTRMRLDATELAVEVGHLTVPPPAQESVEEQ